MDYGIDGRMALVVGSDDTLARACAERLQRSGVRLVGDRWHGLAGLGVDADRLAEGTVDIVVVIAARVDDSPNLDDAALMSAWDVVASAAIMRRAVAGMAQRGWGRLVTVHPLETKLFTGRDATLQRVVGLGALGLSKSISGEHARHGITSNGVLWDGRLPQAESALAVAGAVAFLASMPAAYLSGITLTVDGGAGTSVF